MFAVRKLLDTPNYGCKAVNLGKLYLEWNTPCVGSTQQPCCTCALSCLAGKLMMSRRQGVTSTQGEC